MKDGFGLTPERLLRVLVVVTVLVTIGYLVAFVAVHLFDANPRGRAVRLLSMASERNIPTWFHSVLIFSNGLLMGLLAWDKRRFHEYGVGLPPLSGPRSKLEFGAVELAPNVGPA